MNTLQDISLLVTDGKHGDCQDEEGSGFYFVSCKDVRDGWIDYSGARQITEADYLDTHRRTQLETNDIVITNSGTIGRMALVPNAPETNRTTFQKSVAIVKPNQEKVVPQWLYYSLMANRVVLIGWSGGTAQKNLLLRDMRAFNVDVPPLPTQRKIAAIFSAYDDLIENNLRRIKILEAMAQNLYREWFVKFRFPGHQHARFTDSPLGRIPEGWKVVPLSTVVDFAKGRKPVETRNEPIAGDVRLLLIDALRGGEPQYTAPSRLVIAETRDTIMVMDGGSSCEVAQGFSGAVGSTLGRFRTTTPDHFSPHALYRFLEEKADEFKSKNIGAAIPHANKDYILTQMILLPTQTIALGFHDKLEPIQSTIEILKAKNAILRHTRDLLLPKIITGEVDVSELDIAVPEEAVT